MLYGYDIREIPLELEFCRRNVENFLGQNGLRLEQVDTYIGVFDAEDNLVAGGGLDGDTIKCLAVEENFRGSGLLNALISRLQSIAAQRGYSETMVFTKPEYEAVFLDLGYILLGKSLDALLLESSSLRLDCYKKKWRAAIEERLRILSLNSDVISSENKPRCGICVINANPFTRGHQYLVETAAQKVQVLTVVVVSQDASEFSTEERMDMVRLGTSRIPNIVVVPSGPYAISSATFPTYFLKDLSTAAENQMQLDADVFCRHIAPALGATVRFVGTEPFDSLTCRYNAVLRKNLELHGLQLVEIPRIGNISASKVRNGAWCDAATTSLPFVLSHYACVALQSELRLTPKPGLVDRDSNGAHKDMDYAMMQRSIATLRPFFRKIAETVLRGKALTDKELVCQIHEVGVEAEKAMLLATGGTNTHGGALFSFGLTLAAFCQQLSEGLFGKAGESQKLKSSLKSAISRLAEFYPAPRDTHGSIVAGKYPSVCGALANALTGFSIAMEISDSVSLESDYKSQMSAFLRIMSRLDDTNILYRSDAETLSGIKHTAVRLLRDGFSDADIRILDAEFTKCNISPGGVADMYALSLFISLLYSGFPDK